VRAALLDSIARDVSKPLALITGAAAALNKRAAASPGSEQAQLASLIEQEAERLVDFASVLLDLAKLECQAVEVHPEIVDVRDVVGTAVKDAAVALRKHEIQLNFPNALAKVQVDRAMLCGVVSNLIRHAAQHSPPGSTVAVQAACDRSVIRLQVLDEGEGIRLPDLNKVFSGFDLLGADDESFARAGMHLAVCKGHIEAMGGTITASNRTERSGTVFTITFPISA
jgi:two-component system sensor histidine kinase KdpD